MSDHQKKELKNETILVLGATSTIARDFCEKLALKKVTLILVARNIENLERIAQHIRICYSISVFTYHFDVKNSFHDTKKVENIFLCHPHISMVVYAFGKLNSSNIVNLEEIKEIIEVNFLGALPSLEIAASNFERRLGGTIILLSSVAARRAREDNYAYAAAKAAIRFYCQGLRQRLHQHGCRVITIYLGVVDTNMTYGRQKLPFMVSSERVASSLLKLCKGSREEYYLPWFWRPIMKIIELIPEFLFKRLNINSRMVSKFKNSSFKNSGD